MSQWERNAARLASLVFSLSGRGVVWPTSGGPVCVSDGGGGQDKEQAGQTQVHISKAALDLPHRQV